MSTKYKYTDVHPSDADRPAAVRGAYIYNLIDCIHVCLLRGQVERARRAWAILIRCPDVDWKHRWHWGLYFLDAAGAGAPSHDAHPSQMSRDDATQRWLKLLQRVMDRSDQPAVLFEFTLHCISKGQYREALDHLESYLNSFPYLNSAPLHTLCGLIYFYIAQPPPPPIAHARARALSASSAASGSSVSSGTTAASQPEVPPDPGRLRSARTMFMKALALEPHDPVARTFVDLIDGGTRKDDSDDEMDSDDERARRRATYSPEAPMRLLAGTPDRSRRATTASSVWSEAREPASGVGSAHTTDTEDSLGGAGGSDTDMG